MLVKLVVRVFVSDLNWLVTVKLKYILVVVVVRVTSSIEVDVSN